MLLRLLVGLGLLVSCSPLRIWAEEFRAGPVDVDRPGEVSVVVEFETPPEGIPPKDNFRLVAEGKMIATARTILPFKDSGQGLALIICVDVSGTMKGDPLEEIRTALATLLSKARPRSQDKIALISFADEDQVDSSFEDSREHLDQAVRDLRPRGQFTRLYKTLSKTLDKLNDTQLPKRRRILVISDGKNDEKNTTENSESIKAKSTALGIPIDAVGRGKIDDHYTEALRNLANGTGGHFVFARPDKLALSDALDRIYLDLLETRSLVIYFPYQRDPKGQLIQNASIELLRPGKGQSWNEKLNEGIPRPLASRSWWPWLLGAILLGVFYFIWSSRPTKKDTVILQPPPLPNIPPVPGSYRPPAPPPSPSRKSTVVGSHYFSVPKPGQPTVVLTAVSGPLDGRQFSIEKEDFLIGVSSENDLRVMNDDYVSEDHAYIRYENGSLSIFDKGSRNGTFVNQNQVPPTGTVLSLGDRIRVGRSTFEVTRPRN